MSDKTIDDVDTELAENPATYDAMVIPGGFAPDYMRRNEKMKAAIITMLRAGKPVAAICHGEALIMAVSLHTNPDPSANSNPT